MTPQPAAKTSITVAEDAHLRHLSPTLLAALKKEPDHRQSRL